MQGVEDLIRKLKGLPEFLRQRSNVAMYELSQGIVDMNKQQLLAGVDSMGDSLGNYSPSTVTIRKAKGLQTDHIDLRFTGEFQGSLNIEKKGDAFVETARDPKWNELLEPRWPDALGLTDSNEEKLTEQIIKKLDTDLNNYFK